MNDGINSTVTTRPLTVEDTSSPGGPATTATPDPVHTPGLATARAPAAGPELDTELDTEPATTTTPDPVHATTPAPAAGPELDAERAELLAALDKHRSFLRTTVQGLTDEQATLRPTVSELSLGGLIKHVAATESMWIDFVIGGPTAFPFFDEGGAFIDRSDEFTPEPGETLEVLLERYDAVAERTARVVASAPDLSAGHPLPEAPWFPPGTSWSVRRVVLHLIAETSQHAGHADILRESIDGSRTMG